MSFTTHNQVQISITPTSDHQGAYQAVAVSIAEGKFPHAGLNYAIFTEIWALYWLTPLLTISR